MFKVGDRVKCITRQRIAIRYGIEYIVEDIDFLFDEVLVKRLDGEIVNTTYMIDEFKLCKKSNRHLE